MISLKAGQSHKGTVIEAKYILQTYLEDYI